MKMPTEIPAPRPDKRWAVRLNVWLYSFTRRWLRYFLVAVGLYAGLPILAPALMQAGLEGPARTLYTLYTPFCHQLAFRSFFLFGEQVVYPRYNARSSVTPFETYAQMLPDFAADRVVGTWGQVGDLYSFTPGYLGAAREFLGNAQMGYKTALCARDVGIWVMIFVGGVIYAIPQVRRRLRPVPIWLYVLLGLAPVGIDGISQLLSYPPLAFWPPRETMPIFRISTGILFGLMTAWLVYPNFELSMRETRDALEFKLRRAGLI
jgi:uncharacterized membrane protein